MRKRLYVVGLGPGEDLYMTRQALEALEQAQVLYGYTKYIELVSPLYPEKPAVTTPMTQELKRCRMALEEADQGKTVALVCSGDAGVYGMAGPVLDMSGDFPEVEVEIVGGITAALSGAAVLGAPLMNDFAVISLSDLLTPWETIEKRLRGAAEADFCICLYNPSSRKRGDYLERACSILLESRAQDTVCGWVKNIGRPGQESRVLTLEELGKETVDMFTTVFIGNSMTHRSAGRMVTSRGYEKK